MSKRTTKKTSKKAMKPQNEPEMEPEIKITPQSGKINPIKKLIIITSSISHLFPSCFAELTIKNLQKQRVKGRKARIINFEEVK